jgi:hypothetical protein
MSETIKKDDAIAQAIEQLGGGQNEQLRGELQSQAAAAYKPGMSVEQLVQAVRDVRIGAQGNSDPHTWPGVTSDQPAQTTAVDYSAGAPDVAVRPAEQNAPSPDAGRKSK